MPSLRVGQTDIPYELRRTATISERRITITPGLVEVLALATDDDAEVEAFLQRKRRWVFETVRQLEEITAKRAVVPRFMTGSKIPFRGRMASLTVRRTDGPHIEIAFKNGFVVDLPPWVSEEASEPVVAAEIKLWLNVWTDRLRKLKNVLDSRSRVYVSGLLVGAWAVALMGIRTHL